MEGTCGATLGPSFPCDFPWKENRVLQRSLKSKLRFRELAEKVKFTLSPTLVVTPVDLVHDAGSELWLFRMSRRRTKTMHAPTQQVRKKRCTPSSKRCIAMLAHVAPKTSVRWSNEPTKQWTIESKSACGARHHRLLRWMGHLRFKLNLWV